MLYKSNIKSSTGTNNLFKMQLLLLFLDIIIGRIYASYKFNNVHFGISLSRLYIIYIFIFI